MRSLCIVQASLVLVDPTWAFSSIVSSNTAPRRDLRHRPRLHLFDDPKRKEDTLQGTRSDTNNDDDDFFSGLQNWPLTPRSSETASSAASPMLNNTLPKSIILKKNFRAADSFPLTRILNMEDIPHGVVAMKARDFILHYHISQQGSK